MLSSLRRVNTAFLSQLRHFSSESKVFPSIYDAIHDIKDGSSLCLGGFGLCGIPELSLKALHDQGISELTCYSNDCGTKDFGLGLLAQNRQIKRMVCSYVGENPAISRQYLEGEIELELVPQGTLVEKMRAGGAGIPAFYTPTGVGTWVETGEMPIKMSRVTKNGHAGSSEVDACLEEADQCNEDELHMEDLIFSGHKESRVINGKKYLYEESIKADFGLVKAWKADPFGNLVFHKSAQNFNADVAKCSGTVIAEVEEMVAEGELDPDEIHLPGIYVDRIVVSKDFEKRIESVRVREEGHSMEEELMDLPPEKIIIAKRAAKEFQDGMCVNLGVGIPTLAANFIGPSVKVHIQSENGILGMGPFPSPENVDPDVINAGKQTVSILPSGSAFSSSESFSMIRGGHLQITMLGAFEVSQEGDLANWIIPNKRVQGMGGAMDLVSANNKVIVTTTHLRGDGMPKVLAKCSLPLTGKQVVDMIITDRAVFKVLPNRNGLLLLEFLSSKYSLEDIRATTGCSFKLSHFLKDMETGEPISVA